MSDEDLIKMFLENYAQGNLTIDYPSAVKALRAVYGAGAAPHASVYPLSVGGGRVSDDGELLTEATRSIEALLKYASGLGTVETDDRDQAASLLAALHTRTGALT